MTTTPKLAIVLLGLTSFDVRTSALCNLYDEYGMTYDNLAQEVYYIVKHSHTESLYTAAALQGIKMMAEEVSSDLPLPLLYEEFITLVREVKSKLSYIQINTARLVGIQIEGYDTLVLVYNFPRNQ